MSSVSVRIDKDLYNSAMIEGKAKIGRNALANPDLPVDMVRDILIAREQKSELFTIED